MPEHAKAKAPLTIRDQQRMPTLLKAISADAMLAAFRALFAERQSPLAPQLTACRVEQVYHKGGEKCRILYRLKFQQDADCWDQWLFGQLFADEARLEAKASKHQHETSIHPDMPQGLWPEMRMWLSHIPNDRRLPQLKTLMRPQAMLELAQSQATALGLDEGWRCQEAQIHPVKYKRGKRCLLRCTFDWEGPGRETRTTTVYAKTTNTQPSGYVYDAVNTLHRRMDHRTNPLQWGVPLCHFEQLHTIWYKALNGHSFSQTIDTPGWQKHLPDIAQGLAALHLCDTDQLALRPLASIESLLTHAQEDVKNISAFDFPLEALNTVVDNMHKQQGVFSQPHPATAIHGTFTVGQILYGEDGLGLIDFDWIGIGDPLYDVAEFASSLLTLNIKRGLPIQEVYSAVEAFFQTYQHQVPWACDPQRIRWYMHLFLLGKTHSLLKRLVVKDQTQIDASLNLILKDLPHVLRSL